VKAAESFVDSEVADEEREHGVFQQSCYFSLQTAGATEKSFEEVIRIDGKGWCQDKIKDFLTSLPVPSVSGRRRRGWFGEQASFCQ